MPSASAKDLLAFVDAAPSPYHAVAELGRRLEAVGFSPLDERDAWSLSAGDERYVVRDGGSIVAFRVGREPLGDAGFRLVGAHTDSPTLKVRPREDIRRSGYRQVGVEPYGGVLFHTWLDRDLTVAGRVAVHSHDGIQLRPVHLSGAPLRIPSLAIHLSRELSQEGLKLNPQRHLVPLLGADDASEPALLELLAEASGVERSAIVGHDLVTADTQPSALGGDGEVYVLAPRLDNLASCHAAAHALIDAEPAAATQVLVANDHEEVGSRTAEGAAGSFLADVLERLVALIDGDDAQARRRAYARSWLVSSDMAHAVHPNYADRHEDSHRPRLGGGPALKLNANQSYATDAGSAAWFTARCADVGVRPQHFVVRADLPCGSTIGPITAARLGIATVDVGAPLLSMHSCREQAGTADVELMIATLTSHLAA